MVMMQDSIMVKHLSIDGCLFGEKAGKVSKVSVGDILHSIKFTIMGAMLRRGLFIFSIICLTNKRIMVFNYR